MEQLVKIGLVRSIGVSNFNSEQIERVLKIAEIKPVTNQVQIKDIIQSFHPIFTNVQHVSVSRSNAHPNSIKRN